MFSEVPAIHRFPKAMAERTQKLARAVADEYGGDAEAVWTGAKDGADLLKRVAALPGYGKQKAQILVALLGKQFGVTPEGLAGGRRATTGPRARRARWPTSWTRRAWPRCARSRRR